MKRIIKKFIATLAVISFFSVTLVSSAALLTPGNGGVLSPQLFTKIGSYIFPSNSSDAIGDTSNRLSAVYGTIGNFTNLSFGGISSSIDAGGFNISNAGKITGTYFSATSSTATSTFIGGVETGPLTSWSRIIAQYFIATSTSENSILPNIVSTNSTSTNATSTNMFVSSLSSTKADFSESTSTIFFSNRLNVTDATSSSMAISSLTYGSLPIVSSGGLLISDADLIYDNSTNILTAGGVLASNFMAAGTSVFATSSALGVFSVGTTTTPADTTIVSMSAPTTTIEFGDQFSNLSKVCINSKDANDGSQVSSFIAGGVWVIESGRCK